MVGSTVSIGNATALSSGNPNIDRGQAGVHAKARSVTITSIEDYDSTNSIVNVDNGGMTFSTASTTVNEVECKTYITTMPWIAGSTDSVKDKHDGAAISNTNMKCPYRIQGREFMVGGGQIASNLVTYYDSNAGNRMVYVAPRGVTHSSNTTVI